MSQSQATESTTLVTFQIFPQKGKAVEASVGCRNRPLPLWPPSGPPTPRHPVEAKLTHASRCYSQSFRA